MTATIGGSLPIAAWPALYSKVYLLRLVTVAAVCGFLVRDGTLLVRGLLGQIVGDMETRRAEGTEWITTSPRAPVALALSPAEPVMTNINVGRLIGSLERVIILLFALERQLTAIAFVLTAKSVARFKELEDQRFAEYYLVGTLSSTLLALVAGESLLALWDYLDQIIEAAR